MAGCSDPRMTYLNDAGYNVVRVPRRGIVPLGVIGRDGKARNWLGTLDQIWNSPIAAPHPGPPQPVASLTATRTSDIKLTLGLDILANALSGMFGATAPSIAGTYRQATALQFAFKGVRSVGIDPFAIGEFLSQDAGHAFAPGVRATPVVEPGELVELGFERPVEQHGI